MPFRDRADAGRRLAARLAHLRGQDIVVLGLPRGGVPVAAEVARALDAPLDVIVVRKLGVPVQPELGMGAIGEGGVRIINPDVVRVARVTAGEIAVVEERERAELGRRARRFRGDRQPLSLRGRTAIVVDDGIATGSTARAACQVARAQGADRVILAVPVAPRGSDVALAPDADDVVCLEMPAEFLAIGEWYGDFAQTGDAEVVSLLRRRAAEVAPAGDEAPGAVGGVAGAGDEAPRAGGEVPGAAREAHGTGRGQARPEGGAPWHAGTPPPRGAAGGPVPAGREVTVAAGPVSLAGHLTVPAMAPGIVVFAHGSGSSRHSPRNRFVARVLNDAGLGTLLFDLLTEDEEQNRANVFDIGLLARRLADVTRWLRTEPAARDAAIGYFGASTGAAAALWAAAGPDSDVAAVVSRGGRPDMAIPRLAWVRAPTLLIVGGFDELVLALNREARTHLRCESELAVVPGATHLFEEPGTLEQAAGLARDWFTRHLAHARASA